MSSRNSSQGVLPQPSTQTQPSQTAVALSCSGHGRRKPLWRSRTRRGSWPNCPPARSGGRRGRPCPGSSGSPTPTRAGASSPPAFRPAFAEPPRRLFPRLVGANGAGKSTIIKILGGIARPTAGTILVNGKEVTHRCGYLAHILARSSEPGREVRQGPVRRFERVWGGAGFSARRDRCGDVSWLGLPVRSTSRPKPTALCPTLGEWSHKVKAAMPIR